MVPCWPVLSQLPATRLLKPRAWTPCRVVGLVSRIRWTRTGSLLPSFPWKRMQLRRPRLNEGVRAALRVLVTARHSMTTDRTRTVNALTALLRINDLGLDARKSLTGSQILEVSRWRVREEPLAVSVARSEAVRLAKRIGDLDAEIKANGSRITELVEVSEAAPLLQETGFGPVTAAICLTAWSHQGRVRSEAAFASLAGVNPIPASSGNTVRHRLNRGGDRTLNKALHMVALTRMAFDPATIEYVAKRQAEGRTKKEISSVREALPRPTDLPNTQCQQSPAIATLTTIEEKSLGDN
jgi:transposase